MSTTQLSIRPLTPALQKKAIDLLNEVPERLAQDVASLREWICQQPHLKARTTDQFLVAFLRDCGFDLEKAKTKVDTYYTQRANFPEVLQGLLDDQRVRAIIRLGTSLFLPLPHESDGPRVILIRAGHYPTKDYNLAEIMKVRLMTMDLQLINDDNAVISGYIQLFDFKEFTFSHLLQMNPTLMRCISHYAEDALPMNMIGTHFFNTVMGFGTVFRTIKPLLPERTQKTLYVHSSIDSVYEQVPLKSLPKEYGGENASIDELIATQEENLLKYREYLLEERNYGVTESLRPSK